MEATHQRLGPASESYYTISAEIQMCILISVAFIEREKDAYVNWLGGLAHVRNRKQDATLQKERPSFSTAIKSSDGLNDWSPK